MSVRRGVFLAFVLVGVGWAVGYAQRPEPEFMLEIDAPVGETRLKCVSGCEFDGSKRSGKSKCGPV